MKNSIAFAKIAAVAVVVLGAFAFAASVFAVSAASIYTPATGYLRTGSGMGAMAYQAPNVMAAQTALNACVPGTALVLDGKMGPLTTAKFKAFQASKMITVDGVIGPVTAAQLAACSGDQPTNPSSNGGSLSGGAGSVDEYDLVSSLNNEEVGEDQENVKVYGLEIEADDSSDLNFTAARLVFVKTSAGAGSSDDFEDYADEVSIWMGSEEVATIDADEFNDDNDYTKTVSFDENAVIDGGDTETLYVAISGISNLDSDDAGETWSVEVDNVRFKDAQGAIISEDPQQATRAFSFETFADANDVELKLSLANDNPDAGSVEADANDTTDDVTLMIGEFEAEGSDIEISSLPVSISATGTGDVDEIASSFTLLIDGEEVDTRDADEGTSTDYDSSVTEDADCAGDSCSIVFDDFDFTVEEGDTVEFEVRANINEIDGVTVVGGDSLTAKVTATGRDAIDAEDESGEDLSASNNDFSGTALGEAQAFYASGISVTFISAAESVTNSDTTNGDVATFTIKFKISSFGDTIYVPNVAADSATNSVNFDVDTTGTAASVSGVIVDNSDNDLSSGGNFDIEDGDSENFTLTITTGNSAAGLFRGVVENIRWNTTDSATVFNSYTSNLDDFQTDYVSLN